MTMDDLPAPPGPPPAPTTPPPTWLVGRIFLDRERRLGLGWRLLSYLTLVMAATGGVAAVIAGGDPPVGRNLLAHLAGVALVVAITWLYRRQVDRRSWRDLGLPLPGRPQLVASGTGFALGMLTIVGFFGVLRALGWARVDGGEVAERGVAAVVALLAPGWSCNDQRTGPGARLPRLLLPEPGRAATHQDRRHRRRADLRRPPPARRRVLAATGAGGGHRPHPDGLLPHPDLAGHRIVVAGDRLPHAWDWTMDYVFSLDTAAGPDYGNALVHTRVGGPDLLGPHGGVELLYALISALLPAGYWLLIRRRRAGVPAT
jgi:hypothetical protein